MRLEAMPFPKMASGPGLRFIAVDQERYADHVNDLRALFFPFAGCGSQYRHTSRSLFNEKSTLAIFCGATVEKVPVDGQLTL